MFPLLWLLPYACLDVQSQGRGFIASRIQARNGVRVPGTALSPDTWNSHASLTLESWNGQKEKERGPGVEKVFQEWLPSLGSDWPEFVICEPQAFWVWKFVSCIWNPNKTILPQQELTCLLLYYWISLWKEVSPAPTWDTIEWLRCHKAMNIKELQIHPAVRLI